MSSSSSVQFSSNSVSLNLMALTKTWIRPENTATPAALPANLEEFDVLLSSFSEDGTPLPPPPTAVPGEDPPDPPQPICANTAHFCESWRGEPGCTEQLVKRQRDDASL
ncbi:unnamed protein product [Leuciscus chuanchicus]